MNATPRTVLPAQDRPLDRRRCPRRLDDRLGNLPLAGGIAAKLPGPFPMLTVWAVGGLLRALRRARARRGRGRLPANRRDVRLHPRGDGGELPAFLFGWAELSVIRAASLGAVSSTFAAYFLRFLGHDPAQEPYATQVHWIAAIAIALTATFNYVGVRWGALVQNLTTIAKYGGLLSSSSSRSRSGSRTLAGHFTPATPPGSFSIAPFGLALVGVLWAFDGWADLSFVAGEVKDPRRNLPRALIIGTLAVIVIYLLANVAYLAVMTVDEIREVAARRGRRRARVSERRASCSSRRR